MSQLHDQPIIDIYQNRCRYEASAISHDGSSLRHDKNLPNKDIECALEWFFFTTNPVFIEKGLLYQKWPQ